MNNEQIKILMVDKDKRDFKVFHFKDNNFKILDFNISSKGKINNYLLSDVLMDFLKYTFLEMIKKDVNNVLITYEYFSGSHYIFKYDNKKIETFSKCL